MNSLKYGGGLSSVIKNSLNIIPDSEVNLIIFYMICCNEGNERVMHIIFIKGNYGV